MGHRTMSALSGGLGLALALGCASAAEPRVSLQPPRGQRFFWVWWRNLEGAWRDFIDFTADQQMDGVVIWGLQGWQGSGDQCRAVVEHANARGLKVVHGLGLNGYEVGKDIVGRHPELAAVVPASLAETEKGTWTREAVFCPSKPRSLQLLRECLLRAAATGIHGFNFETADVDYVTCHCPECESRFDSSSETEHTNKPIGWPLEHLRVAADVLGEDYPDLWLTCEFAMQRFGRKPYTDCERILELNRGIDPRMTVVWAEATAPPPEICRALRGERENVGFYIRSGAIHGWEAEEILPAADMLPIARRLFALDPVCVMYRATRPLDRWAVNMGVAARVLRHPQMTDDDLAAAVSEFEALVAPGKRYSFVRRVAPGNLIAPGGRANVTVSSGDALRLVDGVADPRDGLWRTERDSPKEAWALAEWPEPVRVGRVRLFHQIDGEYRSLDYTVQIEADGRWRDLPGMPVRDNPVYGWSEHTFPPVATRRMRVLITRSCHGNRMSLGEWEVYGPQ